MTISKNSYNHTKIPLTFDTIGKKEKEAAIDILNSGHYTMGKVVKEFEANFADYVGAKHCIMVNSGSSANLLLVSSLLHGVGKANPLKPGDEVLVPSLLWPTTLWPITQLGLTPIFVDICPSTLSLNTEDAALKITPKTKAMFIIHVLGIPANLEKIQHFAEQHGLELIEDCCESLGARYRGKHVGNFGKGGTFSFFFSHHISTMEGGAVITNCDDTANDLRSMRAHGWIRDRTDFDEISRSNKDQNVDPRWMFVLPGFNVRPTEVQGAIGLKQIERLPHFISKRKALVNEIKRELENDVNLELIGAELPIDQYDMSWMNVPLRVRDEAGIAKGQIVSIFENFGFETRPVIAGDFFAHPASQQFNKKNISINTQEIHKNGFLIGAFTENHEIFISRLKMVKAQLSRI